MPSRVGLRRLSDRYRRGGRRTPICLRPAHVPWGRTYVDVATLGCEPYDRSVSGLRRNRKSREVGACVRTCTCARFLRGQAPQLATLSQPSPSKPIIPVIAAQLELNYGAIIARLAGYFNSPAAIKEGEQ